MDRTVSRGLWGALALIVLACLALLGLESYQVLSRGPTLRHNADLVAHTFEVIRTAQRLEGTVNELVRNQGAYLITADPNYVNLYRQGTRQALDLLRTLKQLTLDNPGQQRRLADLDHEIELELSGLERVLSARERGPLSPAELVAQTRVSRDAVQSLDRMLEEVVDAENSLLRQRQTAAAEGERQTSDSAIASAAIALVLLVLGLGLTVATFRKLRRLAAERAASEERFRLLVDGVADHALYLLDSQGRITDWNAGAQRLKGYSAKDVLGQSFARFFSPEDQGAGLPQQILDRAAQRGKYETEGWRVRKDGSRFRASSVVTALRDASGNLLGFAKITRDITERNQQQEKLDEARAALAQAQKMEALGQLTGGMAHDFSNFLHVIKNAIEILSSRLRDSDPSMKRYLEMASRNADRAAQVTQRLLAFARQQPLDPKPINPNKLISGMSDLLRQALGAGVHLETVLSGGVWSIAADANQLETSILNLVINARDAMQRFGRLTIETANSFLDEPYAAAHVEVTPGQYVMIAVSDTGTGMTKEVIAKAFEPFFTTKRPGEGTGLGLSQVFGFVKQSGGHVKIYSEPGEGTTVKLYLPRIHADAAAIVLDASPVEREQRTGQTVLVVEDDDDVRAFTAEMLADFGYGVMVASEARTALVLLEQSSGTDLLLTDVGLPNGINGRQLAEEVRRRWPNIKVLFMTGYARNAIVHHGRLDPGVNLLLKPFTHVDLERKVREVLDASEEQSL